MKILLKLRLGPLASAIFLHFHPIAIELAINNPSTELKVAALEFLEVCLLMFPNALQDKLADLRDSIRYSLDVVYIFTVIRLLIPDKSPVSDVASRLYSTVFSVVAENHCETFLTYARSELSTLAGNKKFESIADPYIVGLSYDQKQRK